MLKPAQLITLMMLTSVATVGAIAASESKPMAHHGDCMGMMQEHMKMDPMAGAQKHLAELHSKLKLSKDQEGAWQTFSDQVTAQAKQMGAHKMGGMMGKEPPKTAPERMAMMADMMKDRAQSMSTMADAVKTFYATLSPEQKATFDAMQTEHMQHMGHMGQMKQQERGGMK